MTWLDFVRQYWPSANDGEADCILWNCTCFPFCGLEKVKEQLSELAKRSCGDVGKAQVLAFRDLEEALEKVKDGGNVPDNRQGAQNKEETPKDVRSKPSPRQWARWAGCDCGE